MSKTSETAKAKASKSTAPKKRNEVGAAMFGRDIFVEALEREGVEVIFAYPGGAEHGTPPVAHQVPIRTILPRHEQGGSFAAEGYARATGKAGVCMGTSGPGATNLVTAIADALHGFLPAHRHHRPGARRR
jgi:acetolactate synthase-1/2/3 large subunit